MNFYKKTQFLIVITFSLLSFAFLQSSESLTSELIAAAYNGELQKVEDLVKHGANVNAKIHTEWTALHGSAFNGHLKIVKYLVENRADINAKNNFGQTALHLSAEQGHPETVKYLVEKGANFGKKTLMNGDRLF